MRKTFLGAFALLMAASLFTSCKKECVCKTTYETPTIHNEAESSMGKMKEDDCLLYNRTTNDSEGVTRTIDCHIED